ncbi:MAG TPA: AMP-binding protein [Methylomirabilota bacterium]|jgi:cyclohexanecarboxylate-CoA ligase|nr:AMP-binding protein [Methylomirabilota bacterium]
MDTTLTPARIRESAAQGWWRDECLETYLDRWATRHPDKPALVDGHGRLGYAAVARLVERIAHGLQAHGVGPGSVISCQLPNWSECILLFLAAARLGAVVNPIPPTYRASELRFMLGLLDSQVAVIPEAFRGFRYTEMMTGLRAALPKLEHVFVARGEPGSGMSPWSALTDTAWESREGRRPLEGGDPNRVQEVIFTSGTTGEPKGVMHTPNTTLSTIHALIERLDFSERDVILMSSTVGHQTGFLYGYCASVLLGATAVWLDIWNAAEAARLIEAERVTFTMGATPFLQDLTYAPTCHDLSSLRLFISAGASIPRQLVKDARARLGCAISAGWGMTENGLVTCNGLTDPDDKVFGTDGAPLDGMALRVVDANERDVPAGVEGDLLVTGSAQFVGYCKRPEFTSSAHSADGWFRTGDRATLDGDGYLAITGRSKDLIIRGGENIPVAEVENLLFAHPRVAAIAIVAMPDPRLQERACAFVVPKPGQIVTLPDLCTYLETQQVARQKFPERLEIVSEFPVTASGKVQKYRLRQLIKDKLEAEARRMS